MRVWGGTQLLSEKKESNFLLGRGGEEGKLALMFTPPPPAQGLLGGKP